MKVEVYTDGGCMNNGKKNGKAAYGYYFPNNKDLSFAGPVPSDQPQTNNRGELLGILEAIKKAQVSFPASEVSLHVFTDSEYAKNCITKWMPGWIARGWKTATGTPVINRDIIEDIAGQLVHFDSYTFTHVRAHTGGEDEISRNNHIVDRMVSKVLNPTEEPAPRVVEIKGPLQLMGPPLTETSVYNWCMDNLGELDPSALRSAIMSAYCKTMKKNGYEVLKQKMHRTTEYRLTAGTHLTDTPEEEEK